MTKPTLYQPAPHARVRKPDGSLVAAAGEALPATPYFARLIADGDLVLAAPKEGGLTRAD
jgi:Protein of unknown function (DUF2635)